MDPEDPGEAAGLLRERAEPGRLLGQLADALGRAAGEIFPGAAPLFAALLLGAAVKHAVPSPALEESFGRIVRLWSAGHVFRMAARALSLARGATETAAHLMELLVPVMEGVCLLNGGATERQVAAAGTMLAVTLTGEAAAHVLVPLTGALLGLTAVAAGDSVTGKLANGLKKTVQRLWQFLTICVSFLLGAQTVLAKSADSLAIRTAKFALSSFVPVAGSALAEVWSTVRAGAGFLRGAAGIGGMLGLVSLLLPVIVPLLLYRLVFSLANQAAEALGLGDLASMCAGAAGVAELLTAFVLYAAMLFFVALVLFVSGR